MSIVRTFGIACGLCFAAYTAVAQSLTVSPGGIRFIANADSLNVASFDIIGIGVLGGDKLAFKSAGVLAGPNFLIVSPASGIAPAGEVVVALNPNVVPFLSPGVYDVFLQFAAPGQSCPPCAGTRVILRLIPQPSPSISAVVNAASLRPAISPGALVSIFGTHLGTPPVSFQFDAGGLYPTELRRYPGTDVRDGVTFNGIPAAVLYVSTGQINAVVPYGLAGQKTAEVVVTHNLARSPPLSVSITDTSPAVFTATQNGSGQGAILNNGLTFNSMENPAPKGSVIVMFGTGSGLWSQAFQDGSAFFGASRRVTPAAPVSLTIGGQPARIQYAGPSPFLVSGVIQVNAIVPDGIGSGTQPVVLTIGENSNAQQQVTAAVQ